MNAPASRSELAVMSDRPLSLSLPESELIETLRGSLYAGVSDNMIRLVLGYCRAGNLDPMQKPVHVVPMKVKKPGTRDYEWRDIVMPGVGLYRTQAARTGEHVGTDEPEFGPMQELRVGDFVMQYPEWCKVTVYRMKNGERCAFVAREYWLENYATAGADTLMPNAMWKKRARGQLAKCAEAQALRKAFPEQTGNQPTADEMEGKVIGDVDDSGNVTLTQPARTPTSAPAAQKKPFPAESFAASMPAFQKAINKGKTPDDVLATFEQFNPEFELSKEQRDAILALKPAAAAPATGGPRGDQPQDLAPKVSYAALADRVNKASDRDAALLVLDEARTLPAHQQADLQALFDDLFPQD